MAKRVFFSFHYQDVIDFRANVVRNHWLTKPNRESAGFFDASVWESAKKTGDVAVKRLINAAITNTSVSCVLIGSQTHARRWVRYEIMKSFREGKGIVAVHVNSIKGKNGLTKSNGTNPLGCLGIVYSATGATATLKEKKNGSWVDYTDIGGSATFNTGGVPARYHDKGFQFSQWYSKYDWVADDGYNNFATWVA